VVLSLPAFPFLTRRPLSDTTRAPRPGEVNGVQYHFVSRQDFVSLLDQGCFVEHAEFSGNLYGTSKQAIASIIESGKRCILDIEVQACILPPFVLASDVPSTLP
jgi:guanylate kinase